MFVNVIITKSALC